MHIFFNFLKAAFDKHGYILVRNLFTPDEVAKLKRYMEESREMQNKSYGRSDGKGRRTKVTLWNRAVDDVAGVVARLALMTKNKLCLAHFIFRFSFWLTKLQKTK